MDDNIQQFAKNLKIIRKGKKLTQTQLAEQLGVTKQSIINYEKGVTFPTGNRLNDLFKVLEVTPEQLLTKEFLQMQEEKELIEACRKKAIFLVGQTLDREKNYDYEIERERLMNYFEEMSNHELYQALIAFYNLKIDSAKKRYIDELHSNFLVTSSNLSTDITVNQE